MVVNLPTASRTILQSFWARAEGEMRAAAQHKQAATRTVFHRFAQPAIPLLCHRIFCSSRFRARRMIARELNDTFDQGEPFGLQSSGNGAAEPSMFAGHSLLCPYDRCGDAVVFVLHSVHRHPQVSTGFHRYFGRKLLLTFRAAFSMRAD